MQWIRTKNRRDRIAGCSEAVFLERFARRLSSSLDILPAMNGGDSYGVPAGFAGISGFLPQPPYFSGGLPRGLTFGLSARRSFGREEYMPCRKERQSLTPPCPPPLFGGSFLEKALTGFCLFVSLVLMNESQVRKARKQLLGELPDLAEIVRGSLLDRRIFHRRGCLKCRRGEGHRVWVLTVGYPGGRTRQFTVPAQHKGQVQRWVRNYRRLRAKLEAICELNHELLRADR